MKLLALETTGSALSAAALEDNRIKAFKTEPESDTFSNRLMPMLDGLFRQAGWEPSELDTVAVDVGPGRFTGLRIGVTAGRTLGQLLQKPVVEVTRLEALAAQASGWEPGKPFSWKFAADLLCVVCDAGRGDVYMAVWRFHRAGDKSRAAKPAAKALHTFGHHFKQVHSPSVFPFDRFLSFMHSCFQQQNLLFVGDGAARWQKEIQKTFGAKASFEADVKEPDVRWVAALGAERFYRRETKLFTQLEPLYLRPSYAEENAARAASAS